MVRMRKLLNLDGRYHQDILDQISGLNRQFPGRDYKPAFDFQPLKEGGFRMTVKYWEDQADKGGVHTAEVTHRDDYDSVSRSGKNIIYFGSDDERERFDTAIDTDSTALEESLSRPVDRDEVLSNIRDHGLDYAARELRTDIGNMLVQNQIGLFDLKRLFDFSATRYQINPKLAEALDTTVDVLKELRADGKLVAQYHTSDTE